jgi:hypothetical protein
MPAIGIVREEMVGSEGSCVPWRGFVVAAMIGSGVFYKGYMICPSEESKDCL